PPTARKPCAGNRGRRLWVAVARHARLPQAHRRAALRRHLHPADDRRHAHEPGLRRRLELGRARVGPGIAARDRDRGRARDVGAPHAARGGARAEGGRGLRFDRVHGDGGHALRADARALVLAARHAVHEAAVGQARGARSHHGRDRLVAPDRHHPGHRARARPEPRARRAADRRRDRHRLRPRLRRRELRRLPARVRSRDGRGTVERSPARRRTGDADDLCRRRAPVRGDRGGRARQRGDDARRSSRRVRVARGAMRRGVANADTLDELLSSEHGLRTSALALGAGLARGAGGHCPGAGAVPRHLERELIERIRAGIDPLGEAFCGLRTPAERGPHGAVYTPPAIVRAMGEWAERTGRPDRVVDPGTGSARFLLDAARRFARAELIGFETDRLAALVACANLAAVGAAARARVIVRDYCRARLRHIPGRTLFIGNPPYVRHHELPAAAKEWLAVSAARCGLSASRLASLYVHFFLATWLKAQPGDYGAFITAAEWLDVNYGSLVRRLLLSGLGGGSLTVIDPAAEPFPGTAATAAISTFGIGARPALMRVSRVSALEHLGRLGCGKAVRRERLQAERRWSRLTGVRHRAPAGYVELGELCRVHRGQVTGCNRIW